jgi:glyoxylase-like metal-dependent hydrolase (beta-lactamase superfamily II)
MRMGEKAEALDLEMSFLGNRGSIHPAVFWEDGEGATLIDAGMPGQLELFREKLEALGLKLTDVRRILLTHQDIDHIGSASDIAREAGAEVYAHVADVPYIEGEKPLLKLDSSRVESILKALPGDARKEARKLFSPPPKVPVSRVLNGGEELPFNGGIVVIPTPGHTPGHVSYYLKVLRLLVAGDALRVEGGTLIGPSPSGTPDMRRAIASLKNLQPFPIETVLCYHGGFVASNVETRLKELTTIKA